MTFWSHVNWSLCRAVSAAAAAARARRELPSTRRVRQLPWHDATKPRRARARLRGGRACLGDDDQRPRRRRRRGAHPLRDELPGARHARVARRDAARPAPQLHAPSARRPQAEDHRPGRSRLSRRVRLRALRARGFRRHLQRTLLRRPGPAGALRQTGRPGLARHRQHRRRALRLGADCAARWPGRSFAAVPAEQARQRPSRGRCLSAWRATASAAARAENWATLSCRRRRRRRCPRSLRNARPWRP